MKGEIIAAPASTTGKTRAGFLRASPPVTRVGQCIRCARTRASMTAAWLGVAGFVAASRRTASRIASGTRTFSATVGAPRRARGAYLHRQIENPQDLSQLFYDLHSQWCVGRLEGRDARRDDGRLDLEAGGVLLRVPLCLSPSSSSTRRKDDGGRYEPGSTGPPPSLEGHEDSIGRLWGGRSLATTLANRGAPERLHPTGRLSEGRGSTLLTLTREYLSPGNLAPCLRLSRPSSSPSGP